MFKEYVPIDASGIEVSDFVLNQLRRVLGNRRVKRRKRKPINDLHIRNFMKLRESDMRR